MLTLLVKQALVEAVEDIKLVHLHIWSIVEMQMAVLVSFLLHTLTKYPRTLIVLNTRKHYD